MISRNYLNVINELIFLIYLVHNFNNLPFDNDNQDQVIINFEQFMQIMTENIIKNRLLYGSDKIVFESGNTK